MMDILLFISSGGGIKMIINNMITTIETLEASINAILYQDKIGYRLINNLR